MGLHRCIRVVRTQVPDKQPVEGEVKRYGRLCLQETESLQGRRHEGRRMVRDAGPALQFLLEPTARWLTPRTPYGHP